MVKFVLSHEGFPGVRRRQENPCAESFVFCGFPCALAFSTTDIYRNGLKSHYCVFLETAEIRSQSARLWDVLEMRMRSAVFVCLPLRFRISVYDS